MKPTGTRASRAAASRSERSSGAESTTGSVFGIATTAQKPPAAAARVPVSRSSLCSWPGVRRWTCGSTNAGQQVAPAAVDDLGARRRVELPGAPISAIAPVADEDVVRRVDARARVEHVRAADQQVGGRRGRVDERARRVEAGGSRSAIDGSAVGAGTFAPPASTS